VAIVAELNRFWDQLLQLIEEGKVVPVIGQDLLTIPESTGHTLLYPYLAERLAKYLNVSCGGSRIWILLRVFVSS
jgi:hypothetical protein